MAVTPASPSQKSTFSLKSPLTTSHTTDNTAQKADTLSSLIGAATLPHASEDTDAADSSGAPTPASLSPDSSVSPSTSPSSKLLRAGETSVAPTQEDGADTLRQVQEGIEKNRRRVESLGSSLRGLTARIEALNRTRTTQESSLDAVDRVNTQNARSLKILQIILSVALVAGIAMWILRAKTFPKF